MSKQRTHYGHQPKVVITGVPHSGTRYTATLLRANGVRVNHEEVGRDGTVDWMYPFRDRDARPEIIVHQLRNPLRVVHSLATGAKTDWEKMNAVLPISYEQDKYTCAVKVWLYWSAICERISDMWYKIEEQKQMAGVLEKVFRGKLVDSCIEFKATPRDTNSHAVGETVTLAEIASICGQRLADKLKRAAAIYGYVLK